MPRALIVAPVAPAAGGNGLAMRAGLLLEGLARRHEVDVLLAPVFGRPDPTSALPPARRVELLDLGAPDPARVLAGRLGTAAGRERLAALHPVPSPADLLPQAAIDRVAAAAEGCDVVLVHRTYLAPLLDGLLDRPTRPLLVLDADESDADLAAPVERDAWRRLEAHYAAAVDLVLAAAPEDAERLGGRHLPNAIRPPAGPAGARTARAIDLLMVGTLGYGPNAEGARWLCSEVLPLLPDVRLVLAGARPGPDVLALADPPRVRVLPDVDEVASLYAAAAVAVAPLLRGGGTRIKVLEALVHGRPVVATEVGARGLAAGPDEGVLRASEPAGFAAACRRLLDAPGERARRGDAGRRWALAHHAVDVVSELLDGLLSAAADAPGRPARVGRAGPPAAGAGGEPGADQGRGGATRGSRAVGAGPPGRG